MPMIPEVSDEEQLIVVDFDYDAEHQQRTIEISLPLSSHPVAAKQLFRLSRSPRLITLGALFLCGLAGWVHMQKTRSTKMTSRDIGAASLEDEQLTSLITANLTYNTMFNKTLAACIDKNPWSQIEKGKCYDWIYGRDSYCRAQLMNGTNSGTCEQIVNCLQEKDFVIEDPCDVACSFGHEELQQPVHEECSAHFQKVLEWKRACLVHNASLQEQLAWDAVEPYIAKCRSYQTTSTTTWVDGSLFCFALVVPWSYELGLLQMHHSAKAGIFQCEDSAVYSDREVEIGSNVRSRVLKTNLNCPFNPSTRTVENTYVFKALWEKVMEDGFWRYHDWTVKVDPDTVFFPFRLKLMLTERSPALEGRKLSGVWINNCWHGLHGPIEIMSKNGIHTFNRSGHKCPAWPLQEDNYLENCMGVIQVPRLDAFNILAEKNCERPYYWTCQGSFAAFHPFKDTWAWKRCWDTVSR
eukprot:TRINITY_DN5404_c0_g4_i2.p1 TRINITY_DN5404_c0_g4~~TRINITY_DN5404_c0_g4_i2.p1  ORF type:complete len:466 (+),score=67.26 TRINITY_DN5404_c0_g4_i2:58-1455(+)